MRSLRAAGLALVFLTSCATVNTNAEEHVVARGEFVSRTVARHPVSDLSRLHAGSCRDQLTISATVIEACRRSTRQRVALDREIIREAPAVKYEAIAAALAIGGGTLLAWQTRYGCDDSNPPSCTGSEPLMLTGISTAYFGVGLGAVAIVDALRARDSKERVQSIETVESLEWCGERPAKGRGVTATLAGAETLSGRLDDTGAVTLSLPAGVTVSETVAISVDGAPAMAIPVRELCAPAAPATPKPLSSPPVPPNP